MVLVKIRSGFVSNSSSSSFCLYGASLSKSDLKTFVQTLLDSDIEKFLKEHKYYDMNSFGRPKDSTQSPDDYEDDFDMCAVAEFIDEYYSPNVSLSNAADYECDTLYLGRDGADMLKMMKIDILNKIKAKIKIQTRKHQY